MGLGFLMVTTSGAAQERSKQLQAAEGKLTVRIFDYAGIPQRTLQAASGEAAAILGKAGVKTEWQLCAAAEGQMSKACNEPMRPDELAVRIVRRPKPRNGALGSTECGAAVENTQGLGVSCLSGCFSIPQAVVYGCGAPSVSENLARVSVDVRYRSGMPEVSG